jgi:hypothetical protein
VVGCQDGEIGRGRRVLTPRGRYQVYALNIACPSKMQSGACRGSTFDDVDMQVEVVGGQDQWIEWGWGFWPPKDGYRVCVPDIVCLSKNPGATHKGSAGDGMDTEFEGAVGGECENERGIWHAKPKTVLPGLGFRLGCANSGSLGRRSIGRGGYGGHWAHVTRGVWGKPVKKEN